MFSLGKEIGDKLICYLAILLNIEKIWEAENSVFTKGIFFLVFVFVRFNSKRN